MIFQAQILIGFEVNGNYFHNFINLGNKFAYAFILFVGNGYKPFVFSGVEPILLLTFPLLIEEYSLMQIIPTTKLIRK